MKEDRFVELLAKLIDNVDTLQNNPSQVSVIRFQALVLILKRACCPSTCAKLAVDPHGRILIAREVKYTGSG